MGRERPVRGSGARQCNAFPSKGEKEATTANLRANLVQAKGLNKRQYPLATILPYPTPLLGSTLFPVDKAHLLCLGWCSRWVQVCGKSKERELVRQRLAPETEPIPTPCSLPLEGTRVPVESPAFPWPLSIE